MTPHMRTEPFPTPLRTPRRVVGLVFGALGVSAMLLWASYLDSDSFVRRLMVDNQTEFHLNVHLSDLDRDGWLDLGTITRETEGALEEVLDPGGTWVIRFSYGGVEAGELVIPRSTLREAGWRLAVPAEAGERLAAAGISPSAR